MHSPAVKRAISGLYSICRFEELDAVCGGLAMRVFGQFSATTVENLGYFVGAATCFKDQNSAS